MKIKTEKGSQKKTKTNQPLEVGNDLKAATTDALKKCASELGVAADIYNPQEYREIKIIKDETDAEALPEEIINTIDEITDVEVLMNYANSTNLKAFHKNKLFIELVDNKRKELEK